MARLIFVMAIIISVSHIVAASTQQADSFERLGNISKKDYPSQKEYEEAMQILNKIAEQSSVGDPLLIRSLTGILTDERRSTLVCIPTLRVLSQKGDGSSAHQLVKMMRDNLATLAGVPVKPNDVLHGRMAALIECFIEDCALTLLPKLSDPRPMLDLLLECGQLRPIWFRPDVQQKARRLIATVDVARAIRKEYALKLIKAMPGHPFPEGFEKLFTPEDSATLRTLIQAPNNTPDTFCYGAAGLLAHLGDESALLPLRAFLQNHAKGKPTPEVMIHVYIWQIELQHPPSQLLEHIASDQDPVSSARPWAIGRAVDLNLPKDQIRRAILQRAKHVDTNKAGLRQQELVAMKDVGIELGILNKDDLKGVQAKISAIKVTP